MVSLKLIVGLAVVGLGLSLSLIIPLAGLVYFFALIIGLMFQKFFMDAVGQAAVENMFNKNFGVFLKLSPSRRAKLEAKSLSDPLVKDGNKAFTPQASDYFYLGNIPLVIQPEDNAIAFNPYKEEERIEEGEIDIVCGNCQQPSKVMGKMKMKVPVVVNLPSERLSGFFLRLEDWIIGTLTAQSKLIIMIIAILVALLVLLNIYNIFMATPSSFSSLQTHIDGALGAQAAQIINATHGGGVRII